MNIFRELIQFLLPEKHGWFAVGAILLIANIQAFSVSPPTLFTDPVFGAVDTVTIPWEKVDLTGAHMKPGYLALITKAHSFPWLPVGAGIIGAGTGIYLLTNKKETTDCTFSASGHSSKAVCGLPTGSAGVTVSPSDDYTYAWSNGASGASLSNLLPGNYIVTVTRNGTECSQVIMIQVEDQDITFIADITATAAHCGEADGAASVSVTPAGVYSYQWSSGGTAATELNLAAGSYGLTILQGGCAQSYQVEVPELSPQFTLEIQSTPASCGAQDGTANVVVDPQGTYSYTWSNGAMTQQMTGVPAGEYEVTVTKTGTSCSVTGMVSVSENQADFTTTTDFTNATCGSSDGSATVSVVPPGLYEYVWSNGAMTQQISDVPAGAYQVTVTKTGTTCSITASVTIGEDPANFDITFNTTNADCGSDNGSATLSVNPPGMYDYTWSNGSTNETITDIPAGEYQVTVTKSGTNCKLTASVTISENPLDLDITLNPSPAHCGINDGDVITTVLPSGNYTYAWSNGSAEVNLQQVPAGTFTLTVTNDGGCSKTATTTVDELPAVYVNDITTAPGNCTGDGDIIITLGTPGSGPLSVTIIGQTDTTEVSLPVGQHQLSSILNIPSGMYTLQVYDMGIGSGCLQTVEVTVPDNTPELVAMNDLYTTEANTPVSGNMLDNDQGLGLMVTDVGAVTGGVLDWNPDGSFSFTPDAGFTGIAQFIYTVRDACGNEMQALVQIMVDMVNCTFTVTFTNTNASCGLADGSSLTEVDPPGNYTYQWDTGDTGPLLSGIPAGTYMVTIQDVDLNCFLPFSTSVGEDPAAYISNVQIIQPQCPASGDIIFNLSSAGGGPFDLEVEYPGGAEIFSVPEGEVFLSDYVAIIQGDYLITVTDQNAGTECMDSFEATIAGTTALEITTEAVFPPSSPSSADGVIILSVTMPGVTPYTILLNGSFWGISTDPTSVTIDGLPVGIYTVQLIDVNGCMSNILEVEVPLPGGNDLQLAFGWIYTHTSPSDQPEHAQPDQTSELRSWVGVIWPYYLGRMKQESSLMFVPDGGHSFFRFAQTADLLNFSHRDFLFYGQAGFLLESVHSHLSPDPYWVISGSIRKNIGQALTLNAGISVRGWKQVLMPELQAGIRIPVLRKFTCINFSHN